MLSTLTFSTDNSMKGSKDSAWPEQISPDLKVPKKQVKKAAYSIILSRDDGCCFQ